jgi:two-component system cell cycle sensor histidine kinase/response regulator CckA
MTIRTTDQGLNVIGARDFVARQRTPTFSQICFIMFSAFLVGASIVMTLHNDKVLLVTLFALLAIMGCYVIFHLMRVRDMLLATEFQNALFASAMGLHNKFCLIIKQDGTIIYLDRSFQTLFPNFGKQSSRTVDSLLKQGKVDAVDQERIMHAIDKNTYERVKFDITDAQGLVHRVILSVEPIVFPAGFTMLRGREFVEERQSMHASASGPVLSRSSVTLFSHIMESMKVGVYLTSPNGAIIYCNPLLESWLAYSEGEVVARNLNIDRLIPLSRNPAMSMEPTDIDAVMSLERKVGGYMKAHVNQKIIYNDTGNIMGCTAFVTPDASERADAQKEGF